MSSLARSVTAAAVLTLLLATTAAPARAATWTPPPPTYQLNDAAAGDALSILPPGEHGLYNAADVTLFEANGTRPPGAPDQLGPYANLLYHAARASHAALTSH